jgi:hypothetical protein
MRPAPLAVLGLALGLGLALFYSRALSPVQLINTAPDALPPADQAAYLRLVARAYQVDGDLGRAQTRLSLLRLADAAEAVTALAQRSAAEGHDAETVRALGALAAALGRGPATPTRPAATPSGAATAAGTGSPPFPSPGASAPPTASPGAAPSRTPLPTATVIPSITPRLLPTRTPTAQPPGAFDFVGRQFVCDPALGEPLLQVLAEDAAGQPVAGVEVVITWAGGFDHFYTGLKPDLGLGYGDFAMTPGVDYTLHLAESPAAVIEGLAAENCVDPAGDVYLGSWLLVFRQP